MHAAALNLTTKMTGYQRFLFVCLPQRGAEAELATALDRLEEGIENVHEVAERSCTCSLRINLAESFNHVVTPMAYPPVILPPSGQLCLRSRERIGV
jgi:hypothetical protein